MLALAAERGELAQPIVAGLPDLLAEAALAARREQARSIGDVLLRRTRLGLLAARALPRRTPPPRRPRRCVRVGEVMARELQWSRERLERELEGFAHEAAAEGIALELEPRHDAGRGRRSAARGDVVSAPAHTLRACELTLKLGERPWLMGIVNASPDSFSDGGRYTDLDARLLLARELLGAGADILDVGGESASTGRPPVSVDEELQRVVPLIERLAGELGAIVSVDTYKPAVARAAIAAGARIVNDVSGLRDPALADVCADSGAALVLMHTLRRPARTPAAPRSLRRRHRRGDRVPARAHGARGHPRGGARAADRSTRARTSPRRPPRRSGCWRRSGACTSWAGRC